jgi:hypothetical protein
MHSFAIAGTFIGASWAGLVILLTAIALCAFVELAFGEETFAQRLNRALPPAQWSVSLLLIALILLFGVFDNTQFVYFQF